MFPSDLTPDDIVRARRKAMQEEAMLKAMQEGQRADETPEELRAAMGDIAAQFAAQEARCSTAAAPPLLHRSCSTAAAPLLLLLILLCSSSSSSSRDPPVTRPCP